MKHKRGQITLYLVFIIAAITIVTIGAIFAPMGVRFSTEMYKAGYMILEDSNASINSINDDAVRTQIQSTISNAMDAQENNIEVNSALYQWSWLFILILTALIVFLYTRRLVEYGGVI